MTKGAGKSLLIFFIFFDEICYSKRVQVLDHKKVPGVQNRDLGLKLLRPPNNAYELATLVNTNFIDYMVTQKFLHFQVNLDRTSAKGGR